MELTCPSCGTKHRTEDYPGAFDIQCVCGYSILVPDVEAFHEGPSPGFVSRSPLSQEDSETSIKLDSSSFLMNEPTYTPSEDLPAEMPYDPFEIPANQVSEPQASPPSETQASPYSEPQVNPTSGDATLFSLPTSPSPEPRVTPASGTPAKPSHKKTPPPPPQAATAERTTAQTLVERSQSASLGQLLGAPFDVEAQGLSREALVTVSMRCLKLLKNRPWLETELRRRKINLERIPDAPEFRSLPEIVAVEFYLACIEAGGRCVFRPSAPV